ncbi:acyl-CoA reductase-like NAD-dependent aldehyde dehydrogenase [Gordonia hydrophobica]|nr:acyl-CoA reductase-like NAD-dependent aldehyde dehydrogenase [Gordonia hydrophobica]
MIDTTDRTPQRPGAHRVASAVQTGTIGIGRYIPDPIAPFGGVKSSGIGRELGPERLAAYPNLKSTYRSLELL